MALAEVIVRIKGAEQPLVIGQFSDHQMITADDIARKVGPSPLDGDIAAANKAFMKSIADQLNGWRFCEWNPLEKWHIFDCENGGYWYIYPEVGVFQRFNKSKQIIETHPATRIEELMQSILPDGVNEDGSPIYPGSPWQMPIPNELPDGRLYNAGIRVVQ